MEKFDYYELIKSRRSIRNFDSNKKVDNMVLDRILNAGRLAPTSSNKQPATFRVIVNDDILKKVKPCYERIWFQNAPVLLIITGKRKYAWTRSYDGFNSLEIDLAIMMDHMILAAEYEGLSTCWIIAFKEEIVKNALNLDPDEIVVCMTPLGYPKDDYEKPSMPKRKLLDKLVKYY